MKPTQSLTDKLEACLWWFAMGATIYEKLYGPTHIRLFYRDYRAIGASLLRFRFSTKGRGWAIPDAQQSRLINILVDRCKVALDKQAITLSDPAYIPGYLGKALSRFIDEIANEAQARWKSIPHFEMANNSKEVIEAQVKLVMQRFITEKLANI